MLERLRARRDDESGFTLIELLVVMLIIGILAAIAIPAFFSQRDKGYDSDAKANARTVQTALESYATDHDGSYQGATMSNLADIEGTITNMTAGTGEDAETAGTVALGALTADSYEITATSASGNKFTITRGSTGSLSHSCTGDGCSW